MEVRDAEKDLRSCAGADSASNDPGPLDPLGALTEVYRDYPGLRALIMRRVRDPQLAADILQDAAVTTLEKLRAGKIAQPSAIGGYLYRVALNHLRNHRRKDRTSVSSGADLESLPDLDDDPDYASLDRTRWAGAARRLLQQMSTERDRDLLVRFYLNDESKEAICASLDLTDEHFNRVIFRARNRFRELLERRGYLKLDLLSFLIMVSTICSVSVAVLARVHTGVLS